MERIGPYEPLVELGRGGMGVVLRARCTRTGRDVALKLLSIAEAREADVARFDREAQALVRLRHPSIVAVLDAGQSNRGPWVAMELVEGESLLARLQRDGPLAPEEATTLGRTLCGALEHAHGMGVLHRDVKPANVLLAGDGRVVLVDFGLARVEGRESRMTLTGEVLGTPCYMAPEQADGRPCGPPADIYGLGATLYEALTGQPPFRGKSVVELLSRVLSATPERPDALRPGLPPALSDLVMRCLEKDPARRPRSAAALSEALEQAGTGPARARARPRLLVPAVALLGVALAGATVAHAGRAAAALEEATREAARPDASLLLMRSRAQLKLEDLAAGLASAEEALELAPESAAGLCQRANALAALGRRAEALADCARVMALGDVEVRLLADAALIAWYCEGHAGSVALARRAVALDPTSLASQRALLLSLVASGAIDDALPVASRLLESPGLAAGTACFPLGQLVKADSRRARALVEQARARWPDDDELLILYAATLGRVDEPAAATAALSALIDRSPDRLDALDARARLRIKLHDHDGAAQDAERAVQLAPEDPERWELLATVRERQRDVAGEEAVLTRMLELRPGVAALHARRADLRERLGRVPEMVDDRERAATLAPEQGMNWVYLAQARRRLRDLQGALEAAERGVALVPARFEAYGVRAQALEELGRRAEAGRDYARALELAENPRHKDDLRRSLERVSR